MTGSCGARRGTILFLSFSTAGSESITNKDWKDAAGLFDRAYELDPALLQAQVGKALGYGITHGNARGIALAPADRTHD
jgi:hypothetical protein